MSQNQAIAIRQSNHFTVANRKSTSSFLSTRHSVCNIKHHLISLQSVFEVIKVKLEECHVYHNANFSFRNLQLW